MLHRIHIMKISLLVQMIEGFVQSPWKCSQHMRSLIHHKVKKLAKFQNKNLEKLGKQVNDEFNGRENSFENFDSARKNIHDM